MADALAAPELDAEALEDEIEVVLAEFDLGDSDFDRVQRRRLLQLLFPDHPSRKNVIGERDVIAAATRADLLEMHDAYYVPNNAMLVLAGDVDEDEGLTLARRVFGDWPAGPDPFETRHTPGHPPLSESVAEIITAPVEDAALLVAWHGPSAGHSPQEALTADVLAALSRLLDHSFREVVGSPVVVGAGIDHGPSAHTGVIRVGLAIGPGHERQALTRLRKALNALATPGDIRSDQLETARDEIWADNFWRADSATSVAHAISDAWGIADLDYHERYIDRLYQVSTADVGALVKRYIRDRPFAAVLVTNSDAIESGGLSDSWLKGAL